MAKFQDLTIQTAKIKGGAVTDYAVTSATWTNTLGNESVALTPTNPLGLPLQMYGRVQVRYRTLTTTSANCTMQLRRIRGGVGTTMWSQYMSDSGNSGGGTRTQTFTCSYLELSPVAGDQWQLLRSSVFNPDGGLWEQSAELSVVWVRR